MIRQKATIKNQQAKVKRTWLSFCLMTVACGLVIFPAGVLADFELKHWAKWREIVLPEKATEYVLVALDGPVFDGAREDLSDLRVIDDQKNETGSKVVVISPQNSTSQKKAQPSLLSSSLSEAEAIKLPGYASMPGREVKPTDWLIDLGARHTPGVRMEFDPLSKNFRRHIYVYGSNDNKEWSEVDNTEIFDIRAGRVEKRQLSLDYNEAKFRYLRIRIFNYDDPPLKMKAVRVYGWPRQLLFRREPGRSYRLFYSNAKAAAPRYDLEQLSSYLKPEQLPLASLGSERTNESFTTDSADEPKPDRHPAWLWATLGAAAIVLGALIYRLAKMTTNGQAEG